MYEIKAYSLYFVRFSGFIKESKLCSEVIFSPHFSLKISKHFAKISKHNAYYAAILYFLIYPYHGDGGHCLLHPIDNKITGVYSLYGGDPREIPLYGLSQAAGYVKIPLPTLKSWVKGRKYPVGKEGQLKTFEPVIKRPNSNTPLLSFMNLIEAHVLSGMRRIENVPFYIVRQALKTLENEYPSEHPLADHEFYVHGVDLFIKRLGEYIPVSGRQMAIKEVLETYLRRIDRDLDKKAFRLYPFTKKESSQDEPKAISIDPLISFGRPVLAGTGVPTDIIAERFYAGDSWDVLAKDYDITPQQVQQALRYEAPITRAA